MNAAQRWTLDYILAWSYETDTPPAAFWMGGLDTLDISDLLRESSLNPDGFTLDDIAAAWPTMPKFLKDQTKRAA